MQTEEIKKQLLQRQKELRVINKMAAKACETVVLDQNSVGRLSRMDAMQSQAMNVEAQRRRQMEVVQIDAALKRLDEGEFGECKECGEQISPGRLKIDLTCRLCIRCAEDRESG